MLLSFLPVTGMRGQPVPGEGLRGHSIKMFKFELVIGISSKQHNSSPLYFVHNVIRGLMHINSYLERYVLLLGHKQALLSGRIKYH